MFNLQPLRHISTLPNYGRTLRRSEPTLWAKLRHREPIRRRIRYHEQRKVPLPP